MTQEELKRQLDGILMTIEFPDATPDEKGVYVLRRNDIEGYFARLLPHYASDIADVLISEGLIFKKDYRKSRSAELARQEQFAEEQGFTPDCSPYYIALQYKQRLAEAEYWKSVYDLALNIAFTGEERAYFCKKAEEELKGKCKK